MKTILRKKTNRRAFSFMELQVSLILLGIALAGLVPLVVMQSKQLKKLEARLDHGTTYYLIPSTEIWARKLGAPAMIQTDAETVATPLESETDEYDVNILTYSKSWATESVQARVQLTEVSGDDDDDDQ